MQVHAGKIGSWSALVVMTFVIVADLKHVKAWRLPKVER
jgi:uncharacterized membrane protein YoaT (DUF817 family)